MKIKDNLCEEILTVYGIYWLEKIVSRSWSGKVLKSEMITYFCCIPEQHKAIIVYSSSAVQVIDPSINSAFIYHQSNTEKMHGIFHRALIEEGLYEGLIDDYGGNAYLRFMEILRLERND